MSLHLYTSTACQHGNHTACRVVCQFCVAVCLCRCHWKAEATAHTQTIINIEMHRRQEHLDAGLDGQPDTEPPPVPLVADPKLMTHLIGPGTIMPPPYPKPEHIRWPEEAIEPECSTPGCSLPKGHFWVEGSNCLRGAIHPSVWQSGGQIVERANVVKEET